MIAVYTDSGLTGWGEAQVSRVPEAVCAIVRHLLKPALNERSFRGERQEIESIWDRMYGLMREEGESGGYLGEAIGAVDMALWDLAGKMHHCPIHRMIDQDSHIGQVKTFVSMDCAAPADLMRDALALRAEGFDVFELEHNVVEGELIAALDVLKSALSKSGRVALNARWLHSDWDRAFERQIDQRDLLWIANAVPPEDPFAYRGLVKAMCTPFAVGESCHTHFEVAPLFREMSVGVLQPDLGRCGLTEAIRMAEMAGSHDLPVVVRVDESLGPQLAAAIQFAAMAPNRRVEYNSKALKMANSVLAKPIEVIHGKYEVPAAPGLGIEIEEPELHLMEIQAA
ncbi:MAG: enolase C-terminal domain-like protein [Ignavibacteriota bacterium]